MVALLLELLDLRSCHVTHQLLALVSVEVDIDRLARLVRDLSREHVSRHAALIVLVAAFAAVACVRLLLDNFLAAVDFGARQIEGLLVVSDVADQAIEDVRAAEETSSAVGVASIV